MPTNTTNYNFLKPLVDNPIDQDQWGTQNNQNWDSVDDELLEIQNGRGNFYTTSGSANAYTITTSPSLSSLTEGDTFLIKIHATNTDASTIDVDGIGAVNIKKNVSDDLFANDLMIGDYAEVTYDGVNFILRNTSRAVDGRFEAIDSGADIDLEIRRNDLLRIDITDSTTDIINNDGNSVSLPNAFGFSLFTLSMSNSSGDAEHDMDFAVGGCMSDDLTTFINNTSTLTKQFDDTFALGNNAGGMVDGETIPNNLPFYIYAITNIDGSIVDFIGTTTRDGSTISGDPVVVANSLNKKRYIGAVFTDTSNNIRQGSYNYNGNSYEFIYNVPILQVSTSAPSTVRVGVTVSVPPNCFIKINSKYQDDDVTTGGVIIFDANRLDEAVTQSSSTLLANNNLIAIIQDYFLISSSRELFYKANDGVANFLEVLNLGWKEYL